MVIRVIETEFLTLLRMSVTILLKKYNTLRPLLIAESSLGYKNWDLVNEWIV